MSPRPTSSPIFILVAEPMEIGASAPKPRRCTRRSQVAAPNPSQQSICSAISVGRSSSLPIRLSGGHSKSPFVAQARARGEARRLRSGP